MLGPQFLRFQISILLLLGPSIVLAAAPKKRPFGSAQEAATQFIQSLCETLVTNAKIDLTPLTAKYSTKNLPLYTTDEIWDHKFRDETTDNFGYNQGLQDLIDRLDEDGLFGKWVIISDDQGVHLLAGVPEIIKANEYDDTPLGIRWYSPLHSSLVADNEVPKGYNTMNSIYANYRANGPSPLRIRSFKDRYLFMQSVLEYLISQENKNTMPFLISTDLKPIGIVLQIRNTDGQVVKIAGQISLNRQDAQFRFLPSNSQEYQDEMELAPEQIVHVHDIFPDWNFIYIKLQRRIADKTKALENAKSAEARNSILSEIERDKYSLSIVHDELARAAKKHPEISKHLRFI